jgi:hypothetical protein
MNANLAKGAAAVGAVAVLVFGAAAISGANSSSGSSAAASGTRGFAAPPGQVPQQGGQIPQQGQGGRPPGFGTDVTGAKADKAAKAALAKYPGQVEHIEQLQDGSYVVHVIQSSGEVHVLVSAAFKVTGHQAGPGGPGGFRGSQVPNGQLPNGGQAPAAPSMSAGKTTKS